MEDAVHLAFDQALGDDIVLFSPACKSFDMFMNFEHRGEVFKDAVNSLA
jgi:UDP-N-acetylmuramoylalanine--D-glutamate ligase